GGYNMCIASDRLSILQIIHAVDENIQLTNCTFEGADKENCSRIEDCFIRTPFWNLQNKINQMFDQITLKELIN
ncbi:MAG: Rrf2 family transcriptional regulator, partial [Melioribacteraceae bacterium]|nr:Rrf2 family transcriptional regulator [Melioribacteraceae bacterium]